jgi:hypothetical protein
MTELAAQTHSLQVVLKLFVPAKYKYLEDVPFCPTVCIACQQHITPRPSSRLDQAREEHHHQVCATNKSLLDKVLTQKDKPTRTTGIASSSTMERAPKKAYWLYTHDNEILYISSDEEDSTVDKIKSAHRVRTLCTMHCQN